MKRFFNLALLAGLVWPARAEPAARTAAAAPLAGAATNRLEAGRRLAQVHCGTCHLFPAPELADRRTWWEQILPRMKVRVGLFPPAMAAESDEIRFFLKHGLVGPKPLLTEEEFAAIAAWYRAEAPERAPPQPADRPAIAVGLRHFRFEPLRQRTATPSTTLVRILPGPAARLLVGDDFTRTLAVLDADGRLVEALSPGNPAVAAHGGPERFLLAGIGSFQPSQALHGAVARWERAAGAWTPQLLLTNLPRTTDAQEADLDGDGRPDLVVSMFGNFIGRLSWFAARPGGGHAEHRLLDKPGCIRTDLRDWDGDGDVDILALFAQETEGLFLFLNDGRGGFTARPLLRQHPLFGHSWFEVADVDADGRPDLVVTNGDNGEYPSPLKNYHGVRIHLNRGGLRFEEAWFYPLNGAFRVLARDFDLDGDLDLAALSFFPDYEAQPRESFVHLERTGPLAFRPATFAECVTGRWLVMDAGDLDGDGDEDLVLGSYIKGPSPVPAFLMEAWEKQGPSAVILRNTTRSAPAAQLGR